VTSILTRRIAAAVVLLAATLAACAGTTSVPTSPGGESAAPATEATASTIPPSSTPPSPDASVSASPLPPTACAATDLRAAIRSWQGAAGSRIAAVTISNTTATPCEIDALTKAQLLDASGRILIDGSVVGTPATVPAAGTLDALVAASNYCGPKPVAPVTIGLVITGRSRLEATPASPSDATVPPCLGASAPSVLSMRWGT
jgi:hypothetical protein